MNHIMTTFDNDCIMIALDPNRPLEATECMIMAALYTLGVEEPTKHLQKIASLRKPYNTVYCDKVTVIYADGENNDYLEFMTNKSKKI